MNIITQYIAYLKDNPQGYWFKRKVFGWGWTPVAWQGWTVIGVFIAYVAWAADDFVKTRTLEIPPSVLAIKIVIAVILLIWVCYRKGEKPAWSCGDFLPSRDMTAGLIRAGVYLLHEETEGK